MYKIRMNKNDYFKIHNRLTAINLEISDIDVVFECDSKGYKIIKESKFNYNLEDSMKLQGINFINKRKYLILGIIFLFSLFYINSFRVSEIIFKNETPINNEIENNIKVYYRRLFVFDFINVDFNELSKNINKKYCEYQYINIYKKSNKIYVDIYIDNTKIDDLKDNNNLYVGDIIAKKDAIIDVFYVYSGNCMVAKNQYVRKGDILISGNINETQISSKGLVLGTTYEKIALSIKRQETIFEYTKNSKKHYNIAIFNYNFDICNKNEYKYSDKSEKIIFNFLDIFVIKEIEEKEKNAIIKTYDENSAIAEAESIILKDFDENKKSNLEKIIMLTKYNLIEDGDSFKVVFIAKKLESIGEFMAY